MTIISLICVHQKGGNVDSQLALSRLLQLASPMLPVGAYSYSQGLEWGIEYGDVKDEATAKAWISDVLHVYQANFELPIVYRLYQAWSNNDTQALHEWDDFYQAGRDTAEALAETRQMGYSLCRLLNDLHELPADFLAQVNQFKQPAFSTIYAGVAQVWQIPAQDVLHGYAWGWLENQVSAAMKAVPLGQVAGQKIVSALGQELVQVVAQAMTLKDSEISNFNPLLTIAGCRHETQYSRLFRS
ncbi:MAG: urease accessory protein UreF [Methylophilaceae bacterium]|nr:MAG: urease accessory protein UreF [Methylophilaceae bacterium]